MPCSACGNARARSSRRGAICRALHGLAVVVAAAAGVSACGSGGGDGGDGASSRSPEAYCEAFYSRAAPLRDEYAAAGSADVVSGLLAGVTAPGRLATVFADMARHAPDDIVTDTEAVRDAFQKVQDAVAGSASKPLEAIIEGTVAGAAASDSLDRVGKYLQEHCPLDSDIARKYVKPSPSTGETKTTATETPTGKAPEPGTELAAVTGSGAFSVVTNVPGEGFSIVRNLVDINSDEDQSTVTTYDASGAELAQIPAGSFVGDCQAADIVRADDTRIILTIASSTAPAEGIEPESSTSALDAWDATSGEKLWSADLGDEAWDCDPVNDSGDGIIGFAATPNGRWGIVGGGNGETLIIDLATGDLHESERELHVTGNVLTVRAEYSPLNSPAFDPETVEKVGTFRGFKFYGEPNMAPTGLLDTASVGSSPPAGSSQDGSIVFGLDEHVVAYSVPDMRVAWKGRGDFEPYLHGEAGGVLLTTSQEDDAKLEALDVETGERMWSVPAGDVCGFTNSQLLLAINGQLATIDMNSGEQLSYSDEGDECPDLRAGGIGVEMGSIDPLEEHGVTVRQVLSP